MRLVVATLGVALCVGLLPGCGPILSSVIIVRAEAALEGAQTAGADQYATYEYVAAKEYLHKAREEQGYADFGPAIDFATKAEDMAKKSMDRAEVEKTRLGEESGAQWEEPEGDQATPRAVVKKPGAKKSVPKKDTRKELKPDDEPSPAPSPRKAPASEGGNP